MLNKLSSTDRLCLLAVAGAMIAQTAIYEATDGAALRAAEADKPPAITCAVPAPEVDFTPLLNALDARRAEQFWETVPLDPECRESLQDACETSGVPLCLALGVMEVESNFRPDANSEVSKGLMQLNSRYFPADLTPDENIRAGVAYLGALLQQYDGDTAAALRAYNRGFDDGDRAYANKVLAASAKWGVG